MTLISICNGSWRSLFSIAFVPAAMETTGAVRDGTSARENSSRQGTVRGSIQRVIHKRKHWLPF